MAVYRYSPGKGKNQEGGKMVDKKTSKEEQIGFHKGALSTLVKEREEMMKILNIVEQLMKMHVTSLKELGVDLGQQAPKEKLDDKLRK